MKCKQPIKLRLGDIIRILDKCEGYEGEIAVCIQSDGHAEWPYCCMVVSNKEESRSEYWPVKYEIIGNCNEVVELLKSKKRK